MTRTSPRRGPRRRRHR
uniref:Uncharacterized protein n=1 Tax=Arundo donax TaxID=35708 RepID=A0A0A8Y0I2_ARUDO